MLENTYTTFFGKFPELTEIQKKTIPEILGGKNVLVVASTASGKTEAVVAPICEKMKEMDVSVNDGLFVLYIVPTIALVSDLVKRVKDEIEKIGFSVGSRTKDDRSFNLKKPQNFLFTTPESTDFLLSKHSSVLEKIRFVVIDELHFLDNSYRGDQIRVLLKRLERNSIKNKFSIFCMSATVNEPEKMLLRYTNDGVICKASGDRVIEFIKIDTRSSENYLKKFRTICEKHFKTHQKFLVFCNTKKEVIQFTSDLKKIYFDRQDDIVEHHASLSKDQRKNIEEKLQKNRFAICVCTTTLELGIDIGDIDAVILKNPPPTVSSMLQRIGRSNRRTKKSICFCIYDNDENKKIFSEMQHDAIKGIIENVKYFPDLSVCIQQILSMVYQNHNDYERMGLTLDRLLDFLSPLNFRRDVILKIIDYLMDEKQFLKYSRKNEELLILPQTELLNMIERNPSRIHNNIPDNKVDIPVYDQKNRLIGSISPPERNIQSFNLAAQKWEIVSLSTKTIKVKNIEKSEEIPSFHHNNLGYFNKFIPKDIKDCGIEELLN